MTAKIQYINPDGLIKSPAFSQVVTTQGNGKTIYVGGQNPVNSAGKIMGKNNISVQTQQVMENVRQALTACNATFKNLVKLSIFIVKEQDLQASFQVCQQYLEYLANPPAISVVVVAGLTHPDFLVKIEAVGFVPSS